MLKNLPVEIAENILSRLPTKSLGQSKCVCKSWRSSISSPRFVKSHTNRAVTDTDTNHSRLFTMYPFHSLDYESPSSFADVDDDDDDALVDLGFPSREPDHGVEIVGSSHGLICLLFLPDCFVLWNPTIKDSKETPSPSLPFPDGVMPFKGFGYDPSHDDYKVVRATNTNPTKVEVFSLKNNSWRRIEDLNKNIIIAEEVGICLNGGLHWLAICGTNPSKEGSIVVLDLGNEKFREISKPTMVENKNVSFYALGMFNGCLSLLSPDGGHSDVEVWVMKDYGVSASWIKSVVLCSDDFLFCDYFVPVCSTKNGEIVIGIDGRTLVRYNPEEKASRNIKNRSEDYFEWVLYVESLVSPNGYYD